MLNLDHPDLLKAISEAKKTTRGSRQQADTAAMNAMYDALDEGMSKEEANEIFFSFFNKKSHGNS